MSILLKKEADRFLSDVLDPYYSKCQTNNKLRSKNLQEFWNEKENESVPLSFSYIFDYRQHRIINAKGFDLIGNYSHNAVPNKTNDYIRTYIQEQRYLAIYELRRLILTIFNTHSSYFKGSDKYVYVANRTIVDRNGEKWMSTQTIQPLEFEEIEDINGGRCNLMTAYYSTVQLCSRTTSHCFSSNFFHTSHMPQEKVLRQMNLVLKSIKYEVAKNIGITKKIRNRYQKFAIGLSAKTIADQENVSIKTINKTSSEINRLFKDSFPELMSNYSNNGSINMRPKTISLLLQTMGYL